MPEKPKNDKKPAPKPDTYDIPAITDETGGKKSADPIPSQVSEGEKRKET